MLSTGSIKSACFFGVLLLLSMPQLALAQSRGLETSGTSYYTFARSGQNTIQVLMVGDVRQPGLYEVGEDVELIRLIGLGGGAGAETERTGRMRYVTVQLYRGVGEYQGPIYEAAFSDLVSRSNPPPVLEMGDIVHISVSERNRFDWRDALRIVTSVASLTVALERIYRIAQ